MLKIVVPTPTKEFVAVGGFARALISKTSLSGKENFTDESQTRSNSSIQCVPSNLTMRLVGGWRIPWKFACGSGRSPFALTICSKIVVVRFPERNPAAYTRLPSGVTARARGVSVKSVMMVNGVPREYFRADSHQTPRRRRDRYRVS